MIKINCAVENCSHNNCGTCYANRINVEGNGAKNAETTKSKSNIAIAIKLIMAMICLKFFFIERFLSFVLYALL